MTRSLAFALVALLGPAAAEAQEQTSTGTPTSVVIGIEGGIAQVRGDDTPYGLGYGKLFVIGYRYGSVSMELHTFQTYLASAGDLDAENTVGNISATTIGLRYTLALPFAIVALHGGAGRFKVPILTRKISDSFEPTVIESNTIGGIGLMAGVGAGIPLFGGAIQLTGELRGFYGRWEIPPEYWVKDPTPDADGNYSFEPSADDIEPIPFTLTVGVRTFL